MPKVNQVVNQEQDRRITYLEERFANYNQEMGKVKEDMATIKSDISGMKCDITELKTDFKGIRANLTARPTWSVTAALGIMGSLLVALTVYILTGR